MFVDARKPKFFSRGELHCCPGAVGGRAEENSIYGSDVVEIIFQPALPTLRGFCLMVVAAQPWLMFCSRGRVPRDAYC